MTTETTTRDYRYAGRRVGKGNVLLHRYEAADGAAMHFRKPLRPGQPIGSTVTVEELPGDRVRVTGSALPDGRSPDVDQWAVEDRAAAVAVEAARTADRLRKDTLDLGRMTLDEIARYSARLMPDQRAAVLALVIARLR